MTAHTTSRLRWSCRRGMLELDLWLNGYLDNAYKDATEKDQHDFQTLLEYPDQDLFDWLMGNTQPTDKNLLHIIECIRSSTRQPDNEASCRLG